MSSPDSLLALLAQQQSDATSLGPDILNGQPQIASPFQDSGFVLPPWIWPPDNFDAFDPVAAIATPASGSGFQTVLTLSVPQGWDGVIRSLSHNYTGGGFVEGSGALIWQLMVDGSRAVRNYDAMITQFGTLAQPRDTWGIRIYAGQAITYRVSVTAAAGFIPTSASQIVCSLRGYFWPRANA